MKVLTSRKVLMLAATACLVVCGLVSAEEKSGAFFKFEETASPGIAVEESYVGRHDGKLLVIGGFKVEDSERTASNSVYVLEADGTEWTEFETLYVLDEESERWTEIDTQENHVYGGAVVSTSEGVVCLGGYENGQPSKNVVRYSVADGKVKKHLLPELPVTVIDAAAAEVSNRLYVISSDAVLSLDMLAKEPAWEELDSLGEKVLSAASVGGKLFVFTETDGVNNVLRLGQENKFDLVGPIDADITDMLAVPCGQAHVLFVSARNTDILAYHTITNQWKVLGQLPEIVKPVGFIYDGLKFNVIGADKTIAGEAIAPSTKYGWIDHSVVIVFMVGMLMVGAYLSRREKGSDDYFRGGQRVPWWASGLSLFATGASAISLMAMPGKAFGADWVFSTSSIYCVLTFPLLIFIYMPIARRLKVATSNEYLERRFNVSLRIAGSLIWSLLQIVGRMSAIMLLPAIAISSITGIPITASIIMMGIVTTIYVFLGGLEGVIWTDVMQAVVMIMAVVICAVWALAGLEMSASEAWQTLQSAEKLHMFDWEMTWYEPCVAIMFLNIFITTLGMIGDQNFIQRVQCTPTEKEAKKAVITQMAVAVPLNYILFGLGTILFLFYFEKPEMLSPAIKSDGIFPLFAAQNLPTGLAGLVIAAVLAATMSTLSSAMNSVANLGVEDLYRRFAKNPTDHKCLVLGRVLTLCLGVFGTLMALYLANTKLTSIWDLYFVILGMLLGALTGIFTLGIFTKRANSTGAIIGAIASLAATYFVKTYTHIHFFAYPIVGVVACYIFGYGFSIILPAKKKDIEGLTIYTLEKRKD